MKAESGNTIGITSTSKLSTVTDWLNQGFINNTTSIALKFEGQSISYQQLDLFSNKIAHFLLNNGISKGDHVGICMDRSTEMIACIIGILKVGAAYVPLDPGYPAERLKMMAEDANICLLLLHEPHLHSLGSVSVPQAVWEQIKEAVELCPSAGIAVEIDPEDLAYIIFTSGSTGRPKGIAMPHRALSNLIAWQLEQPYFKFGANVLQYSSISFDVSFQEISTTLASGGALTLVKDHERRDPRILLTIIKDSKIERLFIPFVALRSLVEVAIRSNTILSTLREVITAGEQLRVDNGLRSFFKKLPKTILENQYGPSESHVISAHLLSGNPDEWPDLPPIGKALKNNDIYILDQAMKPVKQGETAELYLAGINLARGYIGRDDLTQKSFLSNPLSGANHPFLYKTGDLGYLNEDGDIKFVGRTDHQIKIRGYRIEPGEINIVGTQYPGVSQCITHAIKDDTGSMRLVTYYVLHEEAAIEEEAFRKFLADALPDYMVPSYVVPLGKIPYTPSGKVDLQALPRPDELVVETANSMEYEYNSDTETQLAEIWSHLLRKKRIPRNADFFNIGGDSLNAVTMFMEIEEQFGIHLPLSVLTQAFTIATLAEVINDNNFSINFNRFRSLQVIQKGDPSYTPLFLVHGGAGNVLMFIDLAKGLPEEQPFYAFQWPGWDGGKGEDDILAMAKFYKTELQQAFPEGPYRLGGYCIGGVIAIEMARLLREEGAEVLDPLLVTDAPNVNSKFYHASEPESSGKDHDKFKKKFHQLNERIAAYAKSHHKIEVASPGAKPTEDHSVRRYPLLAKIFPFYVTLAKMIIGASEYRQLLRIMVRQRLSMKIAIEDRQRYSTICILKAIKKHENIIYQGDILYFKSKEFYGRNLGMQGWWDDLFFGFEELCTGHFKGHVIGGNHNDILKEARVQQIIKQQMLHIDAD